MQKRVTSRANYNSPLERFHQHPQNPNGRTTKPQSLRTRHKRLLHRTHITPRPRTAFTELHHLQIIRTVHSTNCDSCLTCHETWMTVEDDSRKTHLFENTNRTTRLHYSIRSTIFRSLHALLFRTPIRFCVDTRRKPRSLPFFRYSTVVLAALSR